MGDTTLLDERAWTRAWRDAQQWANSMWFRIPASLLAACFAVWTALLPKNASISLRVGVAAMSVVGGVAVIGALTLAAALFLAPYRQRNQARCERDKARDELRELRTDRIRLLKQTYADGKATKLRIAVTMDEAAQCDIACKWAKQALTVLTDHFPPRDREFFASYADAFDEDLLFSSRCRQEIEEIGSAERYVDRTLRYLGDVLDKYDAPA